MVQKRNLNKIQPSLSKLGITYNNLHDPEMDTAKPLVKPTTRKEVLASMSEAEPVRMCKLCAKIPGMSVARGVESKIAMHVQEVYVQIFLICLWG